MGNDLGNIIPAADAQDTLTTHSSARTWPDEKYWVFSPLQNVGLFSQLLLLSSGSNKTRAARSRAGSGQPPQRHQCHQTVFITLQSARQS